MLETYPAQGSLLHVGTELPGRTVIIGHDLVSRYSEALEPAGLPTRPKVNIHSDEDFARRQGLTGMIADGMIVTNWFSSMLTACFGNAYLEAGTLTTKFIKPIRVGTALSLAGQVSGLEPLGDCSMLCGIALWCDDNDGNRVIVGNASVVLPRS